MSDTCKIAGCEKKIYVKSLGLCSTHYNRLRTTGTTDDGPRARASLEERFWRHVSKGDDCWTWVGPKSLGYGVLSLGGRGSKKERSHRLSYMMHKGEIPEGGLVRHTCHNRDCVNPDHLILGNRKDNVDDMWGRESGAPKGNSRLTDDTVRKIRAAKGSRAEVAKQFGISPHHVWQIRTFRSWRHVV